MKKNKWFLSLPDSGNDAILGRQDPVERSGGHVSAMERAMVRKLLQILDHPAMSFVLWNGETIGESSGSSTVKVILKDRGTFYKLLSHASLNFGDLYSAGRIEIEGGLLAFLEMTSSAIANSRKIDFLRRYVADVISKPRINTLRGSKDHINHHYDLGNDFYSLWLDPDYQQYTCAYFPHADMTLEQAQEAKLEHVCRKLQLQSGETVVEAGSGWGGLARYMAKHYGVKVNSYNISHQQVLFAQERAKKEGLDHLIEYVEDDYRNIRGNYDVFVSVGMLEHVGKQHYRGMGDVVDRCLKDHGRGLIHSIGRNKPRPLNVWVERRIFPGAYAPSIGEMMELFEPNDLSVVDVENLRLHYAETLKHWTDRFEQHAEQVERMYDLNFVRSWRLYLNSSISAFTIGTLQLFQILFSRPRNNSLPWSREHLYQG